MPFLERDGVALHYERSGAAGPPVLLLHGWCCDHTYLEPQARHLADAGHDVVALDFRGHGRSDKPVQNYPIASFADDAAWVIGALGLDRPIVIGHSMGGIAAYDLACRYPGLAGAVVMLDAAVARPAAVRGPMAPTLDKLRGGEYRAALRELVESSLFLPTDDPARKARILDAMAEAPQHVMVSAYAGLGDFKPLALPAEPPTPNLYIAADESPRTDLVRLRELDPKLLWGQTVGSGHFCQLEVPGQVNAMIDRFLSLSGLSAC